MHLTVFRHTSPVVIYRRKFSDAVYEARHVTCLLEIRRVWCKWRKVITPRYVITHFSYVCKSIVTSCLARSVVRVRLFTYVANCLVFSLLWTQNFTQFHPLSRTGKLQFPRLQFFGVSSLLNDFKSQNTVPWRSVCLAHLPTANNSLITLTIIQVIQNI